MALLHKQIEEYVGRKIDFSQEVIIQLNDKDEHYIAGWNIEDKKQPTDAQLKEVESKAKTTDATNKLNYLRTVRNSILAESDWVVIKEREEGGSVSNFEDWKKYRQELRDITKTYKSIEDDGFKWPSAPTE
tara:strand:- start:16 stop:408 length:393 start_codon:yes stop_codon:yes gene_type:complete